MARKKADRVKSTGSESGGGIVILKVALAEQKSLWRRIALRCEQTLDDLHEIIFEAFDRYDEHLYSFYFPRPGSRGRARIRNAVEYSSPEICEEPDPWGDDFPRNAAETPLASLQLKPGRTFQYLFDLGDSWWHEITVEETDAIVEPGNYPRILETHGQSPPQYPLDEEE
ncbi:MAG: plasmid pRiA4b ORF-3 family protein [Planctomycetaceae bacterium]|nr:plasmid pRiA4b ORF-3 family protein [Planctomycetaceae bacterium]